MKRKESLLNRTRPLRSPAGALLAAGLLLILFAGCTEEDNPVGFTEGPRGENPVVPETLTVAAPSADRESRPPRTTGTSLSLLVGFVDEEVRSNALLRFASLPDTTGIRYAWLQLYARRGQGEAIRISVRRVRGDADAWSAGDAAWETRPALFEEPLDSPRPVRTGAIEPDGLDTIPRIGIPISLVRFWKENPDSNAGLEISVSSDSPGEGIARISSHNDIVYDAGGAALRSPALFLADSTNTDVSVVEATEDAYIFEDLRPPPTGSDSLAAVSGGPPSRYHLRFDLDPLPRDASILRATLTLPLSAGQVSEDDPVRLSFYETGEEWSEEVPIDSLITGTAAVYAQTYSDSASTAFEAELGALVQLWAAGRENHGLTVRLSDETAAPIGIELFTREAARTPSLRVLYLTPIDDRWEEAR
ncbi:MAG: DNRLRE domain-containing protein [Candidatus Eisenbacteria bacterium]|nr:DNRLRE domain-containing protein [Candidatus Latescibacterota bacterium]MBD3301900.1 DNRLRE domain-containing protein [Candidatus Eisenbacteria bacterium]